MLQLVYLSVAAETWDENLHALVEEAREKNSTDEITGILMSSDGLFLQALEGPQTAVEDAFIRIIKDERHHSLTLLSRRMITRREFGDWAMVELSTATEKHDAIVQVGKIMQHARPNAQAAFNKHFGSVVTVEVRVGEAANVTPLRVTKRNGLRHVGHRDASSNGR